MISFLMNVPYTMIYKLKESDNLQNIWWFMYNNFEANTTKCHFSLCGFGPTV